MKRQLTCIICPIGCCLTAELDENGEVLNVTGNTCGRGKAYAESECTHPVRTLTTTMRVSGGTEPLVSIKSDMPLPKELLLPCMEKINRLQVAAPVQIGDILFRNIENTGIDLVATGNMKKDQTCG